MMHVWRGLIVFMLILGAHGIVGMFNAGYYEGMVNMGVALVTLAITYWKGSSDE